MKTAKQQLDEITPANVRKQQFNALAAVDKELRILQEKHAEEEDELYEKQQDELVEVSNKRLKLQSVTNVYVVFADGFVDKTHSFYLVEDAIKVAEKVEKTKRVHCVVLCVPLSVANNTDMVGDGPFEDDEGNLEQAIENYQDVISEHMHKPKKTADWDVQCIKKLRKHYEAMPRENAILAFHFPEFNQALVKLRDNERAKERINT